MRVCARKGALHGQGRSAFVRVHTMVGWAKLVLGVANMDDNSSEKYACIC